MKAGGAAGLREAEADARKDADLQRAARRIMSVGQTVNARRDAQQEAHHTDARPTGVVPERQFVDESGQTVTIPGPLLFPAWLRSTGAYKDWQVRHDVRTFVTRDDAGNIYAVSTMGAIKLADGAAREAISQIRMYRADRTLAAVTSWDLVGGEVSEWDTMDATGGRITWKVERRRRGDHMALGRNLHFDADGNEHSYEFSEKETVRFESTLDAIGANMRSVREP